MSTCLWVTRVSNLNTFEISSAKTKGAIAMEAWQTMRAALKEPIEKRSRMWALVSIKQDHRVETRPECEEKEVSDDSAENAKTKSRFQERSDETDEEYQHDNWGEDYGVDLEARAQERGNVFVGHQSGDEAEEARGIADDTDARDDHQSAVEDNRVTKTRVTARRLSIQKGENHIERGEMEFRVIFGNWVLKTIISRFCCNFGFPVIIFLSFWRKIIKFNVFSVETKGFSTVRQKTLKCVEKCRKILDVFRINSSLISLLLIWGQIQ